MIEKTFFGCSVKKSDTVYVDLCEEPIIIQGVLEFDTLCPVSNFTGRRGNPLSLLTMALSDKNSRLLDSIIQELPTIRDLDVSDDDKLNLLVSRLDTGSFAEQDALTEQLSKVVDVLFPGDPAVANGVENHIQFNQTNVSSQVTE